MTLSPPLKPEQAAALRKELPGYADILDDVATLFAEDAVAFAPPDPCLCDRSSTSLSAAGMASCRA
ncbi:hypothetical protein WMF31_05580 [Sorangium sp. So ce1036]|uniref:hypothetical protein n=1 Tax=Sorangium sp. So ce1036 TaxID=3133328 RepID=UPI003F0F033C